MSLLGKKILIVGGNGFVGNYFASRLVKQAAQVSAMSRYSLFYSERELNMITHRIRKSTGS
jgi:nucleoside-diphosphate-sugar epimerase